MDARMRASLDRYITGQHLTREEVVLHKCPKCGQEKQVPMLYDMGGWFYLNDDAFCCSVEMKIVEAYGKEARAMALAQKIAEEIKQRVEAGTLPMPKPKALKMLNLQLGRYGLAPIERK